MKFVAAVIVAAAAAVSAQDVLFGQPLAFWHTDPAIASVVDPTTATPMVVSDFAKDTTLLKDILAYSCQAKQNIVIVDGPQYSAMDFLHQAYPQESVKTSWESSKLRIVYPVVQEADILGALTALVSAECGRTVVDGRFDKKPIVDQDALLITNDRFELADTEKALVIVVSSAVNADANRRLKKRNLVTAMATAQNGSSNKTTEYYFDKNQIFSPAVFMAYVVVFVLLSIVVFALSWMTSIQSPTRFEKPVKVKKQ